MSERTIASVTGRLSVNAVPCPTAVSTSIVPPSAWMAPATTSSPTPRPASVEHRLVERRLAPCLQQPHPLAHGLGGVAHHAGEPAEHGGDREQPGFHQGGFQALERLLERDHGLIQPVHLLARTAPAGHLAVG